MAPIHDNIQPLLHSILSLQPTIDQLSKCFREGLGPDDNRAFDKNSADDWRVNIYGNALVRLRLILENNFRVVETLGLVAVTRYIFELTLWLELIQQNEKYALIYRRRLIDTQKRYYEASLQQFEREVAMLEAFGEKDSNGADTAIKKIRALSNPTPEEISAIFAQARDETDAKADRSFSIFSEQAKTNGYGFQAHLVRTQAIPKVKDSIRQLQQELDEFDRETFPKVSDLLQCSKWDKMAEEAGKTSEYEYIYSYTSKLLHCTPASVTTDQKSLEPEEMVVFLRYIHTKIRDVIDLALKQPECRLRIG